MTRQDVERGQVLGCAEHLLGLEAELRETREAERKAHSSGAIDVGGEQFEI